MGKKAETLTPVMNATTYRKKAAALKKYAENYIKRASSHYHKLLKRDSVPCEDEDNSLIELHIEDLSKVLKICYLARKGEFVEAHDIYWNMDSEPQDHMPSGLTNLLAELADAQYDSERKGYRQV